jgi:hypothetical protein
VNLTLCRDDAVYPAGGVLNLRWRISRIEPALISGVELSVLWRTEGKGDEDLSVHDFRRIGRELLTEIDIGEDQVFACRLPASPLSYHGKLIRLCWCVRQRVFIDGRRDLLTEVPFHLVSPTNVNEHASTEQSDSETSRHSRSWLPLKRGS